MKREKLEALSDEKLVRKSQKKDKIAFEVLMERHSSFILSSALKNGNFEVEEVLQITYIKCWQKISTFKFKSSFKTLIYRVLKNNHYDLLRRTIKKTGREVCFSDLTRDDDDEKKPLDFLQGDGILFSSDKLPSLNLEAKEKARDLNKIFKKIKKKLNPAQAKTVELVLEEEMTYKEAAKAMKCSVGTVMSRLFYARQRAQKVLEIDHEKV